MKKLIFGILLITWIKPIQAQNADSIMLRKIFDEALTHSPSYINLEYLCTKFGGRLSGSENAAKAVLYVEGIMAKLGADSVYKQACMVPHWVRGDKESAKIISKQKTLDVSVCALGGSIATSETGITAKVIEVHSFDELKILGTEKIKGKIVFYNRPMDPKLLNTMHAYGGAAGQRWAGASQAAPFGAIGVVVRSMSLSKQDFPHTGSMGYEDSIVKIPACAISTNGADLLSDMLKDNPNLQFFFKQSCKKLEDEPSFNVLAEIKGSEQPEKIIVVGGHLDSWDTGQGAHDDGAGVMQSIEVIRILKALNYKPRYTIRAVAFMNEENGHVGGLKYAELAKQNQETHIAAIESDEGAFAPLGFSMDASSEIRTKIKSWRPLLEPYGIYNFNESGSGTDIEPIVNTGVPGFSLVPESQRYFDYHHSPADTFDKVNKRELELGGAALAAFIYLIDQKGLQ
ncbi:MAG: M20/M25/M40 family metallo-hydrolase [Bacteroidetes bacterium]|nr:M20/M25/M40 family metallo-hydrolase [Bacteroidota bacterium]